MKSTEKSRLCLRHTKARLAVTLVASLGFASAHAAIDFEDHATGTASAASILAGGYTFSTDSLQAITDLPNVGASNGSHYLVFLGGGGKRVSFAPDDQSAFALTSLQLGSWLNFGTAPQSITVIGHRFNGALLSTALTVAPDASFQDFTLTGFTGLSSVEVIGGSRGYVAMDNLVIAPSPIPEPANFALMLAGMGLIGARLRQRKTLATSTH